MRVLLSLAEDLTVERDEPALLESTLEHIVRDLDLSGGVTLLADAQGGLVPAAECSVAPEASLAAQRLAATSIEHDAPISQSLDPEGWMAATPLRGQRGHYGALVLYSEHGPAASPDPALLLALGRQVGTGLENARLYNELRVSSVRTATLSKITAALTSSMDLVTALPAFAEEAATLVSFHRLVIGIVNDSGDYLEVFCYPPGTSWGLGEVVPLVGSGPGSAMLNSTPVVETDLLRSHHFIEDMRLLEEGLRSYMLLPVISRGHGVGVLGFASREPGAFDDQARFHTEAVVDAVALVLDNVRLFRKTRELAITDEITPLYNFRHFHQLLDRELLLVDRYQSWLSLIFLDLDRFKPINDTWGHLRGSRVLREVGFLLRSAVRESDLPARYGGDEFVVICPQKDRAAACELAESIKHLIESHTFLQEEEINARLGLSYGVATYPEDAPTKEALIRLADERMYADKDARKAARTT